MIKSFKNKETETVYQGWHHPAFPFEIMSVAKRKLQMLDAASDLRDLKIPVSNHLEALKGGRKGQWSIRINKQWRLCFIWQANNAYDVEIVDYH